MAYFTAVNAMKSAWIVVPLLLATFVGYCHGYRILGIFPFNGRSHFNMFEPLMKGLARRGHQVDIVSAFPLKKPYPNYTDIVTLPQGPITFVNNFTLDMIEKNFAMNGATYVFANFAGNIVCEKLGHPELLKIARNPPTDPPYDLVIMQVMGAQCFAIFGHQLKVPMIGISTCELYPWLNQLVANPESIAFVSEMRLNYGERMNFWERLSNFLAITFNNYQFNHFTSSAQDELIRKYFGCDAPGVRELERRIALILTNTHHSLNGNRPLTPAVIEVGGLHVQNEEPELSEDLKTWLDESTEGFVYFTFGSMVKIESFPRKTLDAIYESLGQIAPIRVLMKVVSPKELPPGLPENILTQSWMPQIRILKHKNIRAFITHGGGLGTLEAIHHGVPMIGIPLFADQHNNIKKCVGKRIAVSMDYKEITVESLNAALNSVLNDPIYRNAAKAFSAKFLDRPMSALDTAIYWTEYIIQHGGGALRSPAMDLTWWQVELLDVYAFLLLVWIIAVCLTVFVVKIAVISVVSGGTKGNVVSAKKNS